MTNRNRLRVDSPIRKAGSHILVYTVNGTFNCWLGRITWNWYYTGCRGAF